MKTDILLMLIAGIVFIIIAYALGFCIGFKLGFDKEGRHQ